MQQQQSCSHCQSLRSQLLSLHTSSISQKQHLKKQVQRLKQQLQKLSSKLDKRIDSCFSQQKQHYQQRIKQLEQHHQEQLNKLENMITQKDKTIDKMRNMIRNGDRQKRQIIQNHTKILVEISQGIDHQPTNTTNSEHNYKELLKMYQFLIDQNNQLKKNIYQLQKLQIYQQHQPQHNKTEEISINYSIQKNKSITDTSVIKGENHKTQMSKAKEKEKNKKGIPPKNTKK